MCRTLLFGLTGADDDGSVPEKPKKWRDHCSSILMQSVSALVSVCLLSCSMHNNFTECIVASVSLSSLLLSFKYLCMEY